MSHLAGAVYRFSGLKRIHNEWKMTGGRCEARIGPGSGDCMEHVHVCWRLSEAGARGQGWHGWVSEA